MRSSWRDRLVIVLALVAATWMLVDGGRALVTGDYARVEGELGPWAMLVAGLGIDPLSLGMRAFFVFYGAAWLAATGTFAFNVRGSRGAMIAFAVCSLWYFVIGTVSSLVQLALLWKARSR